jgi:hypothetical protein
MNKITQFYDIYPELDVLFFGDGVELHYYLPEEFDDAVRYYIDNEGNLKVEQL